MQIELVAPKLEDRLGPHPTEELQHALSRPHQLLQLVLVQRDRLHGSIARAGNLWWLVGALALGTLLYALPFGAVIGPTRFWSIAALLLGSIAICIPSLHVVGAFIGSRLELAQTLALSLIIASVASLFTFGFFPIIWFLGATMKADSLITPGGMAVFLLCVSQLVGRQAAWFFRPFFGVATIRSEDTPFFLGSNPDFRGTTNFYEAVWQIFSPP